MSAAARLSVVSLRHVSHAVLQLRPDGLVHRQLEGHLPEHVAHRHLHGEGSADWEPRPRARETTSPPYLAEAQLLEHGHADLVGQTNFGSKLFDPEFGDSWRETQ